MKKEFIVERQGRSFVLYAGLLDMAHQKGLTSITTSLIQVPDERNRNVAICTATAVIRNADGVEKAFTGIGDAAANNVAPAMQTCLIRMAETRAKARALRDAVNVGVAAFEELDASGEPEPEPELRARSGRGSNVTRISTAPAKHQIEDVNMPACEEQKTALRRILTARGEDVDETQLSCLTYGQAATLIRGAYRPKAVA